MWEVLHSDSQSMLLSSVKACEEWSRDSNMKLNASKTKEMRVNFSFSSPSYPPIVIDNQTVNIVKHAKILGVIVSNDLKWILHVNAICKKASKRLYALRLLRRNALPDTVLVKVYSTCVRPILVWHNNLPVYLSNQVEQIQKRALRIIFLLSPTTERCLQLIFLHCMIAEVPFAIVLSTTCLIQVTN